MLQIKSQKALKDVDHTKYIFWPQRNKVRNQLTSKTKTGKKKKNQLTRVKLENSKNCRNNTL